VITNVAVMRSRAASIARRLRHHPLVRMMA
jgi:hypothetical protein